MNWEALIIALVPSLTIGVLTYRISRKKDAISEQSGVASDHRAGIAQALQALQDLNKILQSDITNVRADMTLLSVRLRAETALLEAEIAEHEACKDEMARLKRRYGIDEANGALPKAT